MSMSPAAVLPAAEELADLQASAAAAARLMKLMSNEQRLILLCRLGQGECSVGDLAVHVGLAQSAASQHLAKLRAEGVVATRREGQTVYYRLADPAAVRVIDTLCEIYRGGAH
ncbi:MAG: ArsR/SmtB family transcription factor [Phenylobacterium sp.]|uniref:ArsR/SmtB family transcription factor n=1 Tax=Phenylobacterium sp. TaxID=1871053 RepID=UPI003918A6BD